MTGQDDSATILRLRLRLQAALWHRDNWAALAVIGWGLAAAQLVALIARHQ